MLQISKKSEYGLRAMVFLAKNYRQKKVCSVKLISEKEEIPFNFLEKIISHLEKINLVASKKGIQGGYILSKKPEKISVKEIIFNLEKNKRFDECSFCRKARRCLTKNVWVKIEKSLSKTLQNITLAELIK